ncbi:MAG: ABC transporter substrate-binding protein [Chloroflexi bacterium]|nr:ABC transporter substrate-binding protein [Chloroflexota bacterium]
MKRNYWHRALSRPLTRRQVLGRVVKAGIGLTGFSLLGCAAAPAATPTPTKPGATPVAPQATATPVRPITGGILKVAQPATSHTDPARSTGGTNAWQLENICNGLLTLDKTGKPAPELAESWEIPDPTTIVLKLRKGVKFHDGVDFNAQVIKFNYDRILDPATQSPRLPNMKNIIKSYDVVDDYTFKMTLLRPSAGIFESVLTSGTGGMPGQMMSPEAVKKYDNDLRAGKGVGTGPFQMVDWVQDSQTTAKKFPGYWEKGFPYLDEIQWRVIPDPTVTFTMIKTGEVHFAAEIAPKDVPLAKADPNLVPIIDMSVGLVGPLMNQKEPPFNKTALRQALVYAIEREPINKAVYMGLFPVANGFFPPTHWAYDATLKGYPYDPAKAKEKLKEGGAPEGFEFIAQPASAWPEHVQYAEAMKEMLAKVGIKMQIQVAERAKVLDDYRKGSVPMWVTHLSGSPEPHRLVDNWFYSKSGYGLSNRDPEDPLTKQVDALIEKGDSVYNIEDRRAIYSQLQKLIFDNAYGMIVLFHRPLTQLQRKEVQGYEPFVEQYVTRFKRVWLQK